MVLCPHELNCEAFFLQGCVWSTPLLRHERLRNEVNTGKFKDCGGG